MTTRIFNAREIQQLYNQWADEYDTSLWLFRLAGFRIKAYRKAAVKNLNLGPGDTVIDLGCGTGLNFSLLKERIGPDGTVIGVDISDAMLRQAQQRVERNGWKNVRLVHSDIAEFSFPEQTDAILSTLALTMSPDYDRIIKQAAEILKPGKRMSIFELKRPERWPDWMVQMMIKLLATYGTREEHTNRTPWLSIKRHFQQSEMKEYYWGAVHVSTGIA